MAWGFLKRRVVIATLGALVFGVSGATVGVAQVYHPAPAAQARGAGGSHGSQGLIGSIGAGASATATPTSAPPTATSAPPPPPTARPTATPLIPGQNGQIQGRVISVDTTNNTMVVSWLGSLITVTVSNNTAFNGAYSNLSAIGAAVNNPGVDANVQGIWSTTTALNATRGKVDSQPTDN